MLLSLRKRIRVGLYEDETWADFGKGQVIRSLLTGTEGLNDILSRAKECRGRSVVILTANQFSLQQLAPALPQLSDRRERVAYARVVLERAGLDVPNDMVTNVVYRSGRHNGVALGYSRPWLSKVDEVLSAHHIKLRRILPLTAAVLAYTNISMRKDVQIALVAEPFGCTCMVWKKGSLERLDAEPGLLPQAIRRLIARLKLHYDSIDGVTVFHASTTISDKVGPVLREAYNGLEIIESSAEEFAR